VKARQACNALMERCPRSTGARSSAKEAEIAAMGSLESSKWRQLVVIGAIVLAAIVALAMLA
jgi:hypothetical protein